MADHEGIKRNIIFGVGYGRPPEHTRFQKGKSGNSKGRPRKTASELTLSKQPMLNAVLSASQKLIPVREGDQTSEIPARQAVIQAMVLSALKGSPRAQAETLKWFQAADEARARDIEALNELFEKYKSIKSAELAEAAKRGDSPPKILPHPDDIVIDPETGPRFLGPMDEEDQARTDHTLQYRETLIMQDVFDHRSTMRLDGEPMIEPGFALGMAMLLDKALPPRLRMTDAQWFFGRRKYEIMTKRALIKLLFKSWRRLGYPLPRGHVSPNVSTIKPQLEFRLELFREVAAGNINPDEMSNGELEETATELLAKHGVHSGQ